MHCGKNIRFMNTEIIPDDLSIKSVKGHRAIAL